MREARLREQTVRDWIAKGLDPAVELARLTEEAATLEEAGALWLKSRRAISDTTRAEYQRRVDRIAFDLGDMEARHLTVNDVNDWIDRLGLAPSTVIEYVSTLRAILDHVGGDNVARDRRVELPKRTRRVLAPPNAADTLAVLARAHERFRPVLILIEQTGLRVSEACAVRPEHLERRRLLVPVTKTGHPRWVPVPPWLRDVLEPPWPVNRQTVHNALKAACTAADVKPFGPHMLRHRRASLWSAQHVAPAQAAEWLGHTVETYLSTYTHVVAVEEIAPQRLAALLR